MSNKRFEIRAITKATFDGDQWEPIGNDDGVLISFRAVGTNCELHLNGPDQAGEYFRIAENDHVQLVDGLVVIPQSDKPKEA